MVWDIGVAVSRVGELSGEQEFKIEANEKSKNNREIASFINNKKKLNPRQFRGKPPKKLVNG